MSLGFNVEMCKNLPFLYLSCMACCGKTGAFTKMSYKYSMVLYNFCISYPVNCDNCSVQASSFNVKRAKHIAEHAIIDGKVSRHGSASNNDNSLKY